MRLEVSMILSGVPSNPILLFTTTRLERRGIKGQILADRKVVHESPAKGQAGLLHGCGLRRGLGRMLGSRGRHVRLRLPHENGEGRQCIDATWRLLVEKDTVGS